jgi:hypothetical protein
MKCSPSGFTHRSQTTRAGALWASKLDEEVMRMSNTVYRPGQTVPVSGQYGAVNYSGTYVGREVTCVKGEPFPPTRVGEAGYKLRDTTTHRRY